MTVYIIGGIVLLFVIFALTRKKSEVIGSDEAKNLIEKGALLVDVRTPGEFNAGHIKGAKNIPVNEIIRRKSELGKKETPIVLYCRSGARSSRAARMLKNAGFERIFDLGAMRRW